MAEIVVTVVLVSLPETGKSTIDATIVDPEISPDHLVCQSCESWSFISCAATCKNQCSGHGVCRKIRHVSVLSDSRVNCSAEMPKHNKVEVLIPIAFICAFLAVVLLVYVQLREQRCWNRGYTSDDEEESTNVEEPKFLSKVDSNRKRTLRSRPARG